MARSFLTKYIGAGIAFSVASACAPIASLAADADTTPTSAAAATNDSGQLDAVVVTARKSAENIQTVPLSITALSAKELTQQSVKTVTDLEGQVPNIVFQALANDNNALTIEIRGQKQNDDTLLVDPTVGVYIDGLYYPRTSASSGSLVDLDQVEVLRGPQGTLYGRNTTGGALTIKTADPTDTYSGFVDASGGNFAAWNISGMLNIPLSSNTAARFVFERGKHDGYGHDALGRPLDDEDSTMFRGKIRTQIGDNITVMLFGSYQQDLTGGQQNKISGLSAAAPGSPPGGALTLEAAAESGALTPANIGAAVGALNGYAATAYPGARGFYDTSGTYPSSSNYYASNVGVDIAVKLSDSLSLKSITGYEEFSRSTNGDGDATPVQGIESFMATTEHYLSEEFQVLGTLPQFNWVAGLYGGTEAGAESGNASYLNLLNPTNPNSNDAEVQNKNAAAFGQANWEFVPSWHVTGGARVSYDHKASESNNHDVFGCVVPAPGVEAGPPGATECPRTFDASFTGPSWLTSIDHDFSKDALAYFKVAHGYRAGGLNFRGSTYAESFDSYKPEDVTEFEVGLKLEFLDNKARLNLAGYHDNYTNIQRSVTIPTATGGATTVIANAASAKINGFEGEAEARITQEFTLSATTGLTDAYYNKFEDLTGSHSNQSFGVPKWTASITGRYATDTPLGAFAAEADYRWQSSVILDPAVVTFSQVTQGDYGLLNARMSLDVRPWNTTVALFGKNLAAREYWVAAISLETALGYNYVVPGVPRTFGIDVTTRFGR